MAKEASATPRGGTHGEHEVGSSVPEKEGSLVSLSLATNKEMWHEQG